MKKSLMLILFLGVFLFSMNFVVAESVSKVSCLDSEGSLHSINGNIKGFVDFGGEIYEDSCKDEFTLTEYFCGSNEYFILEGEDSSVSSNEIKCVNGCYGGECVEEGFVAPKVGFFKRLFSWFGRLFS